ncbi:MAG TPA: class I SAM-dependent methyltransferase [Thermoleophilaceae bacterium]|nr:class I SAM-dependent methyltransferase [Thermoleophilaceae bacterium]
MASRTNQETSNVEKYERSGGVERRLLERFRATLVHEVASLSPRRVLDAGCGEGIVAGWLREALPGVELAGVDARHDAIEEFRRRNPGAAARVGDLYDLPFPDGEFDLVMAVEVLEHFERPRAALRELARVSSGGVLLTVPHEPFFRGGNLLRGRYVGRLGSTPGHVNAWTRGGFLRMARAEVPAPRWWSSFPWQGITARL